MQAYYLLKTLYLILKIPSANDIRFKTIASKHLPAQSQQQRKV